MNKPKKHNSYKDIDAEKADMSLFTLFDGKQWDYIQHRYKLTPRERQIMEHVCEGLRNRDIAKNVNIAIGTVKTHIRNVHRKTHTGSKIAILLRFIYDVDVFFKKQKTDLRTPITDIQRPISTSPPETAETNSKD